MVIVLLLGVGHLNLRSALCAFNHTKQIRARGRCLILRLLLRDLGIMVPIFAGAGAEFFIGMTRDGF